MTMSGWVEHLNLKMELFNPNIPSEEVFTTPHAQKLMVKCVLLNLCLIKEH